MEFDQDSKPFYRDEHNNKIFVNPEDHPKVTLRDGKEVVSIDGQVFDVLKDESGEPYFINATGKKQKIH